MIVGVQPKRVKALRESYGAGGPGFLSSFFCQPHEGEITGTFTPKEMSTTSNGCSKWAELDVSWAVLTFWPVTQSTGKLVISPCGADRKKN